jgi:hypothetical protein
VYASFGVLRARWSSTAAEGRSLPLELLEDVRLRRLESDRPAGDLDDCRVLVEKEESP